MTTPSLKVIRIFVCTSFILYCFYFFYPFFYKFIYEENVLNYLFGWPIEPLINIQSNFYYLFIGLKLWATIMVFYRLRLARLVFLVATILAIISNTQIGMLLLVHVEIPVFTLMCMLDGIIIYMLFGESIRKQPAQ